jgi:hypothetical protein
MYTAFKCQLQEYQKKPQISPDREKKIAVGSWAASTRDVQYWNKWITDSAGSIWSNERFEIPEYSLLRTNITTLTLIQK